jgi:PTS system nitrogen regulatory IIA component
MDIRDFLSQSDVSFNLKARDKVQLLNDLSTRAAATLKLDKDVVAGEILKREELGSTGVGEGVAIPHARITGLKRPYGIFARLQKPIAFDAIDGEPVDVVFLLLLPDGSHGEQLNALAAIARKLRDSSTAQQIRSASNSAALYSSITANEKGVQAE